MAIKDLMDQAKNHPIIVAVALFACIVVGVYGANLYIKISEQRTGLLGDRITQLERNDRNQKKVNQIILGQIQALRSGYKHLPESLKNVKTEFEYVASLQLLEEPKRKNINNVIEALADDMHKVEMALAKSEAILKTFDNFLNANAAEDMGRYTLAARYYAEAAEIGNIDAQYRLGTLYARGLGVPQNLSDASYWYRKAALSGNTGARAELAQLYLSGRGVQKDQLNALALYKLLEKDVPLSAKERIEEVSKWLTPEQIKAAEELAKEYTKIAAELPNKHIQPTPKGGATDE
jgi:TPR repeat protein